jgi:hypothetical protein
MEPGSFEQVLLALIRRVPEEKRIALLHTVQLLVGRQLEIDGEQRQRLYNVELHRKVRRLTATIRGSLAEAIAVERDERG